MAPLAEWWQNGPTAPKTPSYIWAAIRTPSTPNALEWGSVTTHLPRGKTRPGLELTMPKRSEHPGVYLFKQGGRLRVWWREPATGAKTSHWLDALGFKSKAEALPWLRAKSRELAAAKATRVTGLASMALGAAALAHENDRHRERGRQPSERLSRHLGHSVAFWAGIGITESKALLPEHLRVYRESLKGLPSSRNRLMAAAKSFLRWAHDQGLCGITVEQARKELKPFRVAVEVPKVARPEDLRELLARVAEYDQEPSRLPWRPFVLLCLLAGLRVGEALHLRWANVDLRVRTIQIVADQVDGWTPKGRGARSVGIALSPMLCRELEELQRVSTSQYVCAGPDPKRPRAWAGRSWERAIGKLAISPQTLRRTHETALAMAGALSHYALARHMGHSVQVAERYYVAGAAPLPGSTVEEWVGLVEAPAS